MPLPLGISSVQPGLAIISVVVATITGPDLALASIAL